MKREGWRTVDVDGVVESIRAAISKQHQLQVIAVVLLKPGSIPKTTSGKVQRYACRAGFENDSLNAIGRRGERERGREGEREKELKNRRDAESAEERGFRESRVGADDLIAWLRDYAGNYVNSRLIDERRCIPPHIVLAFGTRGLLGLQVPV